jgi:polyisoprenoid-binding protein YceI
MKKFLFIVLLGLPLLASNLNLTEGFVAAHTEVTGDSTIDPLNTELKANITMDQTLESLRGNFSIAMKYFSSDNKKRDVHMNETTDVKDFPLATYTIKNVAKTKGDNNYMLSGNLNFHGVDKTVDFDVEMTQDSKEVVIKGKSSILVSDYGIDMPCLGGFFLCVDDKVELFVKATLAK